MGTSGRIDLPYETWVHVLLSLDPPDILRFRRVSRVHRDITYERKIWIDALRWLCKENKGTYPFPRYLSPSTKDLESRATAPYRFAARICNNKNRKSLQPTQTRVLTTEQANLANAVEQDGVYFSQYNLVPGGRFLVTILRGILLQIWDMNSPSGAFRKPIGSIHAPKGYTYLTIQTAVSTLDTDEETSIVIAIEILGPMTDEYTSVELQRITISEWDSMISTAIFTSMGRLSVCDYEAEAFFRFFPSRGYLLITSEEMITLWDYIHDTVVRISVDWIDQADADACNLAFCGNYLVRWNHPEVLFYNLPSLRARAEYDINKNFEFGDPVRLTAPNPILGTLLFSEVHFSCAENREGTTIADVIAVTKDNNSFAIFSAPPQRILQVCSYHIGLQRDGAHAAQSTQPVLTPISNYDVGHMDYKWSSRLRTVKFPPRAGTSILGIEDDTIYIRSLKDDDVTRTFTLWEKTDPDHCLDRDNHESVSFCECSGRLVVFPMVGNEERAYGDNDEVVSDEIHILDFV